MVVSVVMLFVMGTFKEKKHLDGNYCTGTAKPLRGYTSQRGPHCCPALNKISQIQPPGFTALWMSLLFEGWDVFCCCCCCSRCFDLSLNPLTILSSFLTYLLLLCLLPSVYFFTCLHLFFLIMFFRLPSVLSISSKTLWSSTVQVPPRPLTYVINPPPPLSLWCFSSCLLVSGHYQSWFQSDMIPFLFLFYKEVFLRLGESKWNSGGLWSDNGLSESNLYSKVLLFKVGLSCWLNRGHLLTQSQ